MTKREEMMNHGKDFEASAKKAAEIEARMRKEAVSKLLTGMYSVLAMASLDDLKEMLEDKELISVVPYDLIANVYNDITKGIYAGRVMEIVHNSKAVQEMNVEAAKDMIRAIRTNK